MKDDTTAKPMIPASSRVSADLNRVPESCYPTLKRTVTKNPPSPAPAPGHRVQGGRHGQPGGVPGGLQEVRAGAQGQQGRGRGLNSQDLYTGWFF